MKPKKKPISRAPVVVLTPPHSLHLPAVDRTIFYHILNT